MIKGMEDVTKDMAAGSGCTSESHKTLDKNAFTQ